MYAIEATDTQDLVQNVCRQGLENSLFMNDYSGCLKLNYRCYNIDYCKQQGSLLLGFIIFDRIDMVGKLIMSDKIITYLCW